MDIISETREERREEMNLVGIIIPAVILAFSFIFTFALYRHFSQRETDDEK